MTNKYFALPPPDKWAIQSWTNFAFIAAGILYFTQSMLMPGIGLIAIGIGSYCFHSKKTKTTLMLDWYGMFIGFSYLILHNGWWHIGLALLFLSIFLYPRSKAFWVMGVFFTVYVITCYIQYNPWTVTAGILVFAIAFLFRHLGEFNYLQKNDLLHGVWHVLAAIGALLMTPVF